MREKIVIIGAGSAMFTRGLVADLIERQWDAELALVDIDSESLNTAEGLSQKMVAAKGASVEITCSTDRRKVLAGATVVICTIGVGGRRAWEQDVFIPRKYGIYQPVGDSVMPGGTSRVLRMVPPMLDIARDVLELCPDALFFNYGNPMGPICLAVRKATGANIVGLCHGVFGVARFLAAQLGVELEKLNYTAVGINHLTWFIEVSVGGSDMMRPLQEIATEKLAEGIIKSRLGEHFAEAGDTGEDGASKDLSPFSWQLLQLFGAYPAAQDRHVTEFFPHMFKGENSYYGKTLGINAYSFEDCIACGDAIFEQMCKDSACDKPLGQGYFERISGEHEEVLEIVESIRQGLGRVYSANLPNTGQVPNLPKDVIIESPAMADENGLTEIQQKPLSCELTGTLAGRLGWQETIVEAALEGSRKKFIQALILDGAVESVRTATKLADELLAAHSEYLPQFSSINF